MLSLLCGFLALAPVYFSVPPPDAPQLAPRGQYAVGVRTVSVVHKDQVDILRIDPGTRKAPRYDRPLTLEIWYPATIPPGQTERTTYENGAIEGKQSRDAPPVAGIRFPLVIVSHGYPGMRTFLSYLTENLASKGYVVAAIDHTDSVVGDVRNFSSTLLNRSPDQLFTINALREMERDGANFLHGLVDARNAAIVGYSMGGYGALISAGAGVSPDSMFGKLIPTEYAPDVLAGPSFQAVDRSVLKAIVAIAPWGRQPPYNAWDARGLAGIHVPALFIAGDHDDVANYTDGIRPAFEQAVNAERFLLIYDEARHNVGGNPPPPGVTLSYDKLQFYEEPVWRKDRICAINQHFITAFLDWKLKGDESKKAFLEIPVQRSDNGKWKVSAGAHDTGAFSTGRDDAGDAFWPGFQRRWALGLEWLHYAAGQTAP